MPILLLFVTKCTMQYKENKRENECLQTLIITQLIKNEKKLRRIKLE